MATQGSVPAWTCFSESSLIGAHSAPSLTYCYWLFSSYNTMAELVAATEMTQPKKPIALIIWPLIDKVC